MFKILLLVAMIVLPSCSSAKPKKWYIKGKSVETRVWEYCHKSKHDLAFHKMGICYIAQKCYKPRVLKERCVSVPLFCAWGDIECLEENKWPEVKKGG